MPTMYCWRHCASRQGMARKLVSGEARRSARAVDDVPATKSDYLRCWFIAKPLASTGERFGTAFLCRRPEMQIIRRTEMLAPYAIRQLSEAIGSWIRIHLVRMKRLQRITVQSLKRRRRFAWTGFPAQSRDMTIQSNPLGRRPTHRSVGYSGESNTRRRHRVCRNAKRGEVPPWRRSAAARYEGKQGLPPKGFC